MLVDVATAPVVFNNAFAAMIVNDAYSSRKADIFSSFSTLEPSSLKSDLLRTSPVDSRVMGEIHRKNIRNIQTAGAAEERVSLAQSNVPSKLEIEANQRMKLLAMKYIAKDKNDELIARLEILNQRLLKEIPRVSEAYVLALEDADEKYTKLLNSVTSKATMLSL